MVFLIESCSYISISKVTSMSSLGIWHFLFFFILFYFIWVPTLEIEGRSKNRKINMGFAYTTEIEFICNVQFIYQVFFYKHFSIITMKLLFSRNSSLGWTWFSETIFTTPYLSFVLLSKFYLDLIQCIVSYVTVSRITLHSTQFLCEKVIRKSRHSKDNSTEDIADSYFKSWSSLWIRVEWYDSWIARVY